MAADEALASAQAEVEKSKTASVRLMESLARKLGKRRGPRATASVSAVSFQEPPGSGAVIAVTLAGVAAGLLVGVLAFRRRA